MCIGSYTRITRTHSVKLMVFRHGLYFLATWQDQGIGTLLVDEDDKKKFFESLMHFDISFSKTIKQSLQINKVIINPIINVKSISKICHCRQLFCNCHLIKIVLTWPNFCYSWFILFQLVRSAATQNTRSLITFDFAFSPGIKLPTVHNFRFPSFIPCDIIIVDW